ncbi:MAG: serine/threonine-protein kinase [Planctomycetaceae bacterium]
MPFPLDQFLKSVTECGLVPPDRLRAVQNELPREQLDPLDAQYLARELVVRKLLTPYQATAVYEGKAHELAFGKYLVLDQLGQGGMGLVYKAEHRPMRRVVALKVMSPAAMKAPEAVQRFHREVEAAAKLSHPNIVAAFDADEAQGRHFLVMEFVDGTDLASFVRRQGPLSIPQAVDFIRQAAAGLAHAHEAGIVHRDIKPHNLLLDAHGTVKVFDLGLARFDENASAPPNSPMAALTKSGSIMGTVDYMSPEQALDTRHADRRSDIYSLGCTLHFLLTGRPVYSADTLMQRLLAHRDRPIPSLPAARPDAPPPLVAVFERMVAKRAEARYQSMAEVIEDLRRIAAGPAPATAPRPASEPPPLSSYQAESDEAALRAFLDVVAASGMPTVTAKKERAPAAEETLVDGAAASTLNASAKAGRLVPSTTAARIRLAFALGLAALIPALLWWRLSRPKSGDADAASVATASTDPWPALPKEKPDLAAPHRAAINSERRQVILPADGWQELLPLIDVTRDVVAGEWSCTAEALRVRNEPDDARPARLHFPVQPSGGYDFAFTFVRQTGAEPLAVLLPVGTRAVVVKFAEPARAGGTRPFARLHRTDGHELINSPHPAHVETLVNGRAYRLRIMVRLTGPEVQISSQWDDQGVLDWSGASDRLSATVGGDSSSGHQLGFEVAQGEFEFRDIELLAIDGAATIAVSDRKPH